MSTVELTLPVQAHSLFSWKRSLLDSMLAFVGSMLTTLIIYVFHLYPRIPNISIVYLLVVLALASTRGRYAAILASLVAFLSFDYFLVPPLHVFTISVPIIVLSVKDAERDKVEALDLGADDYVAKPFGIGEVLARVRVALRRAVQPPSGAEPRYQTGPLSVDFAQRHVELDGKTISLTPTEFDLLKAFIIHWGKILTRHMLLKEVWGEKTHARAHNLHVYVAQLRQKVEPEPERPQLILTVPGVGYRFNDAGEA